MKPKSIDVHTLRNCWHSVNNCIFVLVLRCNFDPKRAGRGSNQMYFSDSATHISSFVANSTSSPGSATHISLLFFFKLYFLSWWGDLISEEIRRGGRGWAHPSSPGPPDSNPDEEKETRTKTNFAIRKNTFYSLDKYIGWFGQIQHQMLIRRGGSGWTHPSSPGPHSNPDKEKETWKK